MITLDTKRIDDELEVLKTEARNAEEFRNKAVSAANRYIERIEPLLKKRGIKIAQSQMYFNSMDGKHDHALVILEYEECYCEWESVKAKNLEKALVEVGIPMPISNVNRNITITLYDEGTSFDGSHREGTLNR